MFLPARNNQFEFFFNKNIIPDEIEEKESFIPGEEPSGDKTADGLLHYKPAEKDEKSSFINYLMNKNKDKKDE